MPTACTENHIPLLNLNGRLIGPGQPTFIIAEMSANHHQDFDQAVQILQAAKAAGADAIKLQTYTPETMTLDLPDTAFEIGDGTIWAGRRLFDLYREAATPWAWHAPLQKLAAELDLIFFSTPFDDTAVAFLESLDVPAFKIASFELVDLPLIRRVARTGKPLIMSTGMATKEEIAAAVAAARAEGNYQIALLKCTSAYPAPPEEMHLRTIPDLAQTFKVPVGLSDHSLEPAISIAAVALGACLLEKHLTLSRAVPGPDSAFSLEPEEFQALVAAIRVTEKALGRCCYEVGAREAASRFFRRSLFVVAEMQAGEPFTLDKIKSLRPALGLPPKYLDQILGRRATRKIRPGTPLSWDLVGDPPEAG